MIRYKQKYWGYLFGLFEGDGYKYHDLRFRHRYVEFYLNSERDLKIINSLIDNLKSQKLNPLVYQDKRFNCTRIRINSKEMFFILDKNIKIDDKSKEFKLGYVSGMIDSEGYVDKNKSSISIVNINKSALEQIKSFLYSIDVNSKLSLRKPSKRDKTPSYRIYISVKFKRHPHLSIKVQEAQT